MSPATVMTSKLRGPVRTMTSHVAEWDPVREEWGPPRHVRKASFDSSGRLTESDQPGAKDTIHRTQYRYDSRGRLTDEHAGAAGAQSAWVTRYSYDDQDRVVEVIRTSDAGIERIVEASSYDAQGCRTRVETLPEGLDGYGVDGSELAYGAPGARTQITYYDEHGRSTESVYHDAHNRVVRRVRLTRDADGRTMLEESTLGEGSLLGMHLGAEELTAEDRAAMQVLLHDAFGASTIAFTYDTNGLLVERIMTMGRLSEDRHVFEHDDHGNVVSDVAEERSREMGMDESGALQQRNERALFSETRFTYVYDPQGNWTERVISSRHQADAPMIRRNVERRTIEYF